MALKSLFKTSETSIMEVRCTKNQVVLWSPDARAYLNHPEITQLLDALNQIAAEQRNMPVKVSLCLGDIEIRNFKTYIEFTFFVHSSSGVTAYSVMLDKQKLSQLISGLEQAAYDIFGRSN